MAIMRPSPGFEQRPKGIFNSHDEIYERDKRTELTRLRRVDKTKINPLSVTMEKERAQKESKRVIEAAAAHLWDTVGRYAYSEDNAEDAWQYAPQMAQQDMRDIVKEIAGILVGE